MCPFSSGDILVMIQLIYHETLLISYKSWLYVYDYMYCCITQLENHEVMYVDDQTKNGCNKHKHKISFTNVSVLKTYFVLV